jgi:hypothetical protein
MILGSVASCIQEGIVKGEGRREAEKRQRRGREGVEKR